MLSISPMKELQTARAGWVWTVCCWSGRLVKREWSANAVRGCRLGRSSLIAHRHSTIHAADRIMVLHKGTLREVGNHDTLMAEDGIYARLYRLQAETDSAPFDAESRLTQTPKVV